MPDIDGVGLRSTSAITIHKIWLGLGIDFIWWKSIPALIDIELFGWEDRTFRGMEREALTIIRIKLLFADFEVFVVGGRI